MKIYIFIFFIFFSEVIHGNTLQPLKNNSLEDFFTDEKASNTVLERCVSLYSAVTELIRIKYPELASEFYEIANTLYPYGILSLSKTNNIPYEEAEKFFFINVNNITNLYIDEMKKNGEKNGSYFKWSFIGDDLRFCHEVTKHLQLVVLESLGE